MLSTGERAPGPTRRRERRRERVADARRSHRGRATAALAVALASALLGLGALAPAGAQATLNAQNALIYMPYGLIHSLRSNAEVDGYLTEVDSYGIDQFVFAMPAFKKLGALKAPKHNRQMLELWSQRASVYDAAHATGLSLTIVFNGKIKTKRNGLDLDEATTRANIVSAVESSLALGASGVQLDLEPYPTSAGFITLLEEIDAMFARVGFGGRLSVTAPASVGRWSPSYLERVTQLVTQVDPLYYDSESTSTAAYQAWMRGSLAYYSANASSTCLIVPVLPSYSANPWHVPSVEDIEHASVALGEALGAGSRVDGAGIWSGWGFLLDEEGAYDGSGDRAAWRSLTAGLPFSS